MTYNVFSGTLNPAQSFIPFLFIVVCICQLLLTVHTCINVYFSSDHIVAQQANRYIVAFHIAISYDMQRPPYNGWALGLPPTRCMYGLI